jgi:hypothetical protein
LRRGPEVDRGLDRVGRPAADAGDGRQTFLEAGLPELSALLRSWRSAPRRLASVASIMVADLVKKVLWAQPNAKYRR